VGPRNIYYILVGKSLGKQSLARPEKRREYNIKKGEIGTDS
jgi:hypothetical protein